MYKLLSYLVLFTLIQPVYALEFFVVRPVTEDYKKLEANLYQTTYKTKPYTSLTLPSLQFYYGIWPDIDIDLLLNYAFYYPHTADSADANGIGDTFFTSTYVFMKESTYAPQMAIIPSVLIPTGDYDAGLGNGKPAIYIPLSGEKTWQSWKLVMNVGYAYNMAPFTRNYFYGGARVGYTLNKLGLGIELYHQGATSDASNSDVNGYVLAVGQYTLLNIGGDYQLTNHWLLQLSAGKNISGSSVFTTFLGINYSF